MVITRPADFCLCLLVCIFNQQRCVCLHEEIYLFFFFFMWLRGRGAGQPALTQIIVKKHGKKNPMPVCLPSAALAFKDGSDGKYMVNGHISYFLLVAVAIRAGNVI